MTTFKELARVNTGTHFLDSGFESGRHWQQPAIPDNAPLYYWDGSEAYPMFAINTAQMLDEHLTIDDQATRHFRLWAAMVDPDDRRAWLDLAHEYKDRMVETGRWSDKGDGEFSDNVFNWETDFDQVFQFVAPTLHCDAFLIQMHNGADVRGGYTAPVVATGDLELIICMDRINLDCPHCYAQAEDIYQGEEDGWKVRVNKQSASWVCPECNRTAMNFPRA